MSNNVGLCWRGDCYSDSNSISDPGKYTVRIEEAFQGSINGEPTIKIKYSTSDGKEYLSCYWLTGKTNWKLQKLFSELCTPKSDIWNDIHKTYDDDLTYNYIYDHLIGLVIEIEFEIDQWHLLNKGRSILKIVKYSPFTSTVKVDLLTKPEIIPTVHQVTALSVMTDEDIPF